MELGHRLRQARLDAGLSQRQLCAEIITRNMLSQIENGSAKPSMDTLCRLAERLGKPISYFLDEAVASSNQALLLSARAQFLNQDYRATLQVLSAYQPNDPVFDPEYYLMLALCHLRLAETEDAAVHLQACADAGANTPYFTPALERERLLALSVCPGADAAALCAALPIDQREAILRARTALQGGDITAAICYLDTFTAPNDPAWLLLRGDAALAAGQTDEALTHYRCAEVLSPQSAYPKLEQYFLQTEDYKQAYFYACKQRSSSQ